MIIYTKRDWTIPLLFRCYGSAIPRSCPVALLTSVIAVCLMKFYGNHLRATWRNPFAYSIFASIVGFIVVFRAQWAHERYTLGRANLQTMSARWADAIAQALSFDNHMRPSDASPQWLRDSTIFHKAAIHLGSLLHGVALMHLRNDWDLNNITEHISSAMPPANDAKNIPSLEAKRNGFYDLCFLRAEQHQQDMYYRAYPVGVIGDINGSEVEAMTRRSASDRRSPARSAGFMSPTNTAGAYVAGPGERINVVKGWLYAELAKRRRCGGLAMDAPVLANVWARISEGYVAFEQCRMLVETPFPFPWTQLLTLILVLYVVSLPFMVAVCMTRQWLAVIVTFVSTITHWATNEVARDLEDPFVYYPNDLPSARLQYLFNERLLQEAAAILYDAPHFPDFIIPATSAETSALGVHAYGRVGRDSKRRCHRRHRNVSNSSTSSGSNDERNHCGANAVDDMTQPLLDSSRDRTPSRGDAAV